MQVTGLINYHEQSTTIIGVPGKWERAIEIPDDKLTPVWKVIEITWSGFSVKDLATGVVEKFDFTVIHPKAAIEIGSKLQWRKDRMTGKYSFMEVY